jgi:hypothetical protein
MTWLSLSGEQVSGLFFRMFREQLAKIIFLASLLIAGGWLAANPS